MYFGDNKDITYLAKTNFRNKEQVFGIRRKDRRQHMYVLGKSGTGKSVLMYNMIIQNIANGAGVCVVDPHGELVEDVLKSIPAHRVDDVIYFNPADITSHMGFNVLEIEDPQYKHLVASGLMGIFTKIWANTWSARMEYILNNSILALLDTPGTTLLGIPRILVDKEYRKTIIENLKDPVVKAFWIQEYEAWQDKFRNEAIAPIQNKVGQFLSSAMIRNVVGQSKSTINIFDIMNQEKVFLVNVSKGRIGEDNSALLGGMLITKIQLAAMERVRIPENDRKDFYLYVDEFQNFVTDSFASILSEARKYRLCLTIAHQYTGQLMTQAGSVVRDAVFGNVGTMIIFRVGAEDATFLEKELEPEFTTEDIVNQPNYHVYMKLMVDGITSRPFSAWTLPPYVIENGLENRERIIKRSKELYTVPREVVEERINDWSGMTLDGSRKDGAVSAGKWKAVCSQCGTEIMVPFEPQEGRSVYCKDCMTKIKNGEIKPVQKPKPLIKKDGAATQEPMIAASRPTPTTVEKKEKPVVAESLLQNEPVTARPTAKVVAPIPPKAVAARPAYIDNRKPDQKPAQYSSSTQQSTPKYKDSNSYKKPHDPRPPFDQNKKIDLGKIISDALKNGSASSDDDSSDATEAQATPIQKATVETQAPAAGTPSVSLQEMSKHTTDSTKHSGPQPQYPKKNVHQPVAVSKNPDTKSKFNFAAKETSANNMNSLKSALAAAMAKKGDEFVVGKYQDKKESNDTRESAPANNVRASMVSPMLEVSKSTIEPVIATNTTKAEQDTHTDSQAEQPVTAPKTQTSTKTKEVPEDLLRGILS